MRAARARPRLVVVGDERRGDHRGTGVPGPGVRRPWGSSGRAEARTTGQRLLWESGGEAGVSFRTGVGTARLSSLLHPRVLLSPQPLDSLPLSKPPQPPRISCPSPRPLSEPQRPLILPVISSASPQALSLPPGRRLAHPHCLLLPHLQPRASPASTASPPLQPAPARPPHSCNEISAPTRAPGIPSPGQFLTLSSPGKKVAATFSRPFWGWGWLLPAATCAQRLPESRGPTLGRLRARADVPGSSG